MSASADHPLARVFRNRGAVALQLDTGIVNKFLASYKQGGLKLPTGILTVTGAQWRVLLLDARLTAEETYYFHAWLNATHGSDVAENARRSPSRTNAPSWHPRDGDGNADQGGSRAPSRGYRGADAEHSWPSVPPAAGYGPSFDERRAQGEQPAGRHDVMSNHPFLAGDSTAMGGITGQSIITLTFVMLTGRLPLPDDELAYGADVTLSKAYARAERCGDGTMLVDLLGPPVASGYYTVHDHFRSAVATLRGCGETVAAQRLADMWDLVQRSIPPLVMQRKYLMEYIRKYAGRGVPVLIDTDIVLRVLSVCYGADSLGAALEEQAHEMSLLRSELAAMRAELGQVAIALKKRDQKDAGVHCLYCHMTDHLIGACAKKKAADERAKAALARS